MATAADIVLSQAAGRDGRDIDAVCLGSGRFLRAVLVPLLSSRLRPAVFQTRGRTFLDSLRGGHGTKRSLDGTVASGGGAAPSLRYPVDAVEFDGGTTTSDIEIFAAGTLGTPDGRARLMDDLISKMDRVSVIGVGVTEAGLQRADTQCMRDLTQLLHALFVRKTECPNPNGRICVVNTDNVPDNGRVIRGHVLENAKIHEEEGGGFVEFLKSRVAFLNSMVDRITSSRPGSDGLVPLCEPLPGKALVVCDEGRDLPPWMSGEDVQTRFGVKIRNNQKDLESDIALKLRVANGTHTAVAHAMALSSLVTTEALGESSPSAGVLGGYLDSLYEAQIRPAAAGDGIPAAEADATWDDWRRRLRHPHFGLSTFFITQNGAAKCGIRLGPTIRGLAVAPDSTLSFSTAFAAAAILRFLTPATSANGRAGGLDRRIDEAGRRGVRLGWLDAGEGTDDDRAAAKPSSDTVTYADGLRYNLGEGWYEFRCDCPVAAPADASDDTKQRGETIALPEALSNLDAARQPRTCEAVVRSYLVHPQGGDLGTLPDGEGEGDFDAFVGAVAKLYARMVGGDGVLLLLRETAKKEHDYTDGFATSCACLK